MAKLNKAARGKHRWIGFEISMAEISRSKCENIFSKTLSNLNWRLFDLNISDNVSKGIVKVPLEDYENAILLINNNEYLETLTSSGKIRLVRERLKLK